MLASTITAHDLQLPKRTLPIFPGIPISLRGQIKDGGQECPPYTGPLFLMAKTGSR
jgi:hypothetical protein